MLDMTIFKRVEINLSFLNKAILHFAVKKSLERVYGDPIKEDFSTGGTTNPYGTSNSFNPVPNNLIAQVFLQSTI